MATEVVGLPLVAPRPTVQGRARVSVKKFEILEMIAKGGMAEVYRARTTGLQGFEKEVCVKKILPHLTEDEDFVTMFIDEAKLAATLSFANIVQVHDLCVSAGGEYFIVMEYVDGKDLSDIIRAAQLGGAPLPPDLAVHIAREVCQGLAYAHARTDRDGKPLGIIHRDISPHNVLVSRMGEVKLVDFGIAKASSSMTKTAVGILKGKYGYMSPEQARGKPLDGRSDLFNTGILLYEMLVGERCFAGATDFSTLSMMRNAEVVPPREVNPNVPEGLQAIILKALSLDPADRPADAFALEGELGAWAKANQAVATKSDLARYLGGLLTPEKAPQPKRDGIIEVQSVVGPPPRPTTPAVPSLAAKPVQIETTTPPKPETKPERGESRKAPPPPPAAAPEPTAPPAAEKKEVPAEPKPEPKPEPAEAAKPAPEPAKPKAPAAKKKAAKKKAPVDKKPIGRRHLRPDAPRGSTRRRAPVTAFSAALVLLLAGAAGVGVGWWRRSTTTHVSAMRAMDLLGLRAPDPKFGLLLVESRPSGRPVRIDGEPAPTPTPVVLATTKGAKHRVELDGIEIEPTVKGRLLHVAAPESEPPPPPSYLELILSPPERVTLDGKNLGTMGRARVEVEPGEHQLRIGARRSDRRQLALTVEPGQTRTLVLGGN